MNEHYDIKEDDEEKTFIKEKESKDSLINILQNLERDLIIKNKCQKEFKLEDNNDKTYEKVEIFGNPDCFYCLKSKKKDKFIQLFYCSHCKKLLCRECLSIHYNSNFENIEDTYIKYIKEGSHEIINKNLPQKMNKFKFVLFKNFVSYFNIIYLFMIFLMKPIMNTLWEIILNCIKEAFTHKIDEPDSLFNFYKIYFENAKKFNFDFDLMMIMNWLGDKILESIGFIYTCFVFIGINSIYFILFLNFNFIEYNINNKYSIWKFLLLILIYLIIFVGIGGSSLLSQRIFIELNDKIAKYEKINKNDNHKDNYNEDLENIQNVSDESSFYKSSEIDDKRKSIKENSKMKKINREKLNENTNLKSFYDISICTILANYFISLKSNIMVNEQLEKDELIRNETLNIINDTLMNNNTNNPNINKIIYDNDKNYFIRQILITFFQYMGISIFFFLISISCCLINNQIKKENDNENKVKKALKEYSKEDENIINNEADIIKLDDEIKDVKLIEENKDSEDIKDIQKTNSIDKYSICKFCGYFYYNKTVNLRGQMPLYKILCCGFRDCFFLNMISLIDCCNITFCHILNKICCEEKEIFKCYCGRCNKNYNKVSDNFCLCYKEKRKYEWLHDYITNETQEDIFPYILEYCLLGLIVIALDKKYETFKFEFQRKKVTTFKEFWEKFNDNKTVKSVFIFPITFLFYFSLCSKFGSSKLRKLNKNSKEKKYDESILILNGIHGILLINSIISLVFSILYFLGIKDFDDYILIPILMYKFFYFTLNYYCICLTKEQNDHEFILSGKILITIYIIVWNQIYKFLKNFFNNELFLFIFQAVLSIIIILSFIYYSLFSRFNYIICENLINCNLFGSFQSCCNCCNCCIYNIYCLEGYQYCDCCCCDEDCFCYCQQCDKSCYILDCFSSISRNYSHDSKDDSTIIIK